jgi:hypothetical protein
MLQRATVPLARSKSELVGEANLEVFEMHRTLMCAWLTSLAVGAVVHAQESTTYEVGPDGTKYQVTTRVVQRSVPTTEYQTREQKVYRPQVTTQYQSYQQTYLTPVTQYQWVARLNGRWNPFVQPYWTHELAPVTRWEARPTTLQIPVARTDWVEETRTAQVPVTTYRTATEQLITKVPVGTTTNGGAATSVASLPIGSQQLQNDPPAGPSPWAPRPTGDTFKR